MNTHKTEVNSKCFTYDIFYIVHPYVFSDILHCFKIRSVLCNPVCCNIWDIFHDVLKKMVDCPDLESLSSLFMNPVETTSLKCDLTLLQSSQKC